MHTCTSLKHEIEGSLVVRRPFTRCLDDISGSILELLRLKRNTSSNKTASNNFTIHLAVLTTYRSVTDGRADGHTFIPMQCSAWLHLRTRDNKTK